MYFEVRIYLENKILRGKFSRWSDAEQYKIYMAYKHKNAKIEIVPSYLGTAYIVNKRVR